MAARHIRYDRAWRKGFRHDPSLDLVAPASAPEASTTSPTIDANRFVQDEPHVAGQPAGYNVGLDDRLRSIGSRRDENCTDYLFG